MFPEKALRFSRSLSFDFCNATQIFVWTKIQIQLDVPGSIPVNVLYDNRDTTTKHVNV